MKKWTVMIYMAADNNLDPAAIDDINEMAAVGSTDDVNIVVQLDREIDELTRRLYITKNGGYGTDVVQTLSEFNTGDPQVLVDFAGWATANYPAERYMLVIWNHGGGWYEDTRRWIKKRNIAYDDGSQGDSIDNAELVVALSSIKQMIGKNLDILGMDACLMAQLEVAYQIRDFVNIMIGSEEEEPTDGWPYDAILDAIVRNPGIDPILLSRIIVDSYINSYQDTGEHVTQSAVNLQKLDPVLSAFFDFADALNYETMSWFPQVMVDAINRAWIKTQRFFFNQYVDLSRFAYNLMKELKKADLGNNMIFDSGQRLIKALSSGKTKAVIRQRRYGRKVSGARGLSVYFPDSLENWNDRYANLRITQYSSYWQDFVKRFLGRK